MLCDVIQEFWEKNRTKGWPGLTEKIKYYVQNLHTFLLNIILFGTINFVRHYLKNVQQLLKI